MHVIIVGAGEVGWFLAQRLGAEGNDVVVIEQDEAIASAIGAELDVQVLTGDATTPSVLRGARVERATLFAAVTQRDEVNLLCSFLAKQAGVEQTIVRIQNPELRGGEGQMLRDAMGADVIIDPDADTADAILSLVDAAGADEVYPVSGGDLEMIGAVIGESSPLAGQLLGGVASWIGGDLGFVIGALTHDGRTLLPRGDQRLEAGDHVRVLTTTSAQHRTLELLDASLASPKRAMVLGGGAIGSRVAEMLQVRGTDVVLVENDLAWAGRLSERLHGVTIIHGDIQDVDFLDQESVTEMDLVVAATGNDSANVLACAFAASGPRTFTIAVLHRLSLLPLVRRFGVDAALSPRTASANAVLHEIREGTGSVSTFLESDIEVDEMVVEPGSPAEGRSVSRLDLGEVVLGAIVHADGRGELIGGPSVLQAGDNVVVFVRPSSLPLVRKAFSA
ncbi:MAG: Trk system potassium transporter TrkA [Iamia sp.]